jgi:hypothetical protein
MDTHVHETIMLLKKLTQDVVDEYLGGTFLCGIVREAFSSLTEGYQLI